MVKNWIDRLLLLADGPSAPLRALGVVVALLILTTLFLMFWWDSEPEVFDPHAIAAERARDNGQELVAGYVTTATLIHVAETLLDKRGGYLRNDVMPPGVLMDNIPAWEFGVVVQVRDLSRSMRNDFSRSQTQSTEDPDLAVADPQFSYDSRSWIVPATESEYRAGIEAVESYLDRLADPTQPGAQFYTRADNLVAWLELVEKRLGGLSQKLSASVGQERLNTDLSGDPNAKQATNSPNNVSVKTPWLEIDDVFYEARGATWALVHFLRAVEEDFDDLLRNKNAVISLRQIIRELEETQAAIYSPMVLNGSGFGAFANHSLVMANYISRANAGIIDLRSLLKDG